MGDLVTKRMRDLNHRSTVPDELLRSGCARVLVDEAADLIDKLRAENERLRAALTDIAEHRGGYASEVAQVALASESKGGMES